MYTDCAVVKCSLNINNKAVDMSKMEKHVYWVLFHKNHMEFE